MVDVDPANVQSFASAAALERWLRAHHARARELWLQIYKQRSGRLSVTYAEAVQVALCWGWIDGLRKRLDEQAFLQRFTPRTPKSIWSQINREHVARLIAEGRMQAPGLAQVEAAQADGRWAAAYAPVRQSSLPEDLLAAIEAEPRARATLARLDRRNTFALSFRLGKLKTAAARARKIEEYVALFAQGKALHPLPEARPRAAAPRQSKAPRPRKKVAKKAIRRRPKG